MGQTPTVQKSSWRKRLLYTALVLLVLSAALIGSLPLIAKSLLISELEKLGAEQVELETLQLNLFTGRFALQGLSFNGPGESRLTLQALRAEISPYSALFDRHILVRDWALKGLSLDVKQLADGWQIAGLVLPQGGETEEHQIPSTPWRVSAVPLPISEVEVALSLADFQQTIKLNQLILSELDTQQVDQPLAYSLQLVIAQSELTLEGTATPLAETIQLHSELALTSLPLLWLQPYLTEQGIRRIQGSVDIQLILTGEIGESIGMEGELKLDINKPQLHYPPYEVDGEAFSWQGRFNYFTPSGDSLGLQLDGDLKSGKLRVMDKDKALLLSEFNQLSLSGLQLSPDKSLEADSLEVQKLSMLGEEPPFSQVEMIWLEAFQFDGKQSVSLNQARFESLLVNLSMGPEGELLPLAPLQSKAAEKAEAPTPPVEPEASEESKPWHYHLGKLDVTGNSRVVIDDQSVSPPFQNILSLSQLTLGTLDSQRPDNPSPLTIKARLGEHQQIAVEGELTPIADTLNITLHGTTQSLELPPLSPYVEKHLGYYLKRGLLDSNFDITIAQQQLDAKLNLKLKKFQIEEGDPAKVKSLTEELTMPLDSALDLLRDGDDNIKLELAINGDINDPKFDTSKVINRALGKATKVAATSYVKHLLYPWGTLWSLAEMVGDRMVTRMDPVEFLPGDNELDDNYVLYLDKVVTLLTERPKIELNICGLTSEQDRSVLPMVQGTNEVTNAQLLQLAEQRSQAVKNYLVESGIDAGRLYLCHPEMQKAEKNSPIVDLYF